ncbi:MAG TPA: hypothetical protein VF541_01625 [Longimicrobium sp.]|jgi:hypothetical protein
MAQQLTDVIAERTLELMKPGSDAAAEVRVRVGRPFKDPDPEGDWICPVQILGIGDEEVTDIYGIDAIQALILGLQIIGTQLAAAARSGLELRWFESPDLGFPMTFPSSPGPPTSG